MLLRTCIVKRDYEKDKHNNQQTRMRLLEDKGWPKMRRVIERQEDGECKIA